MTGGSGFIAGNLIPKLLERGYEVYALNRYVTGRYVQNKEKQLPFFKEVNADLNDHDLIREIIIDLKPEYIIHLASISAVSYSYDHPFEVLETNFKASVNLAEVNRKYNSDLKQFLFAGTSEEYGIQEEFPIKESSELRPNSPYSVSKVAADKYLNYMRDANGFPITILRNFNTYGRKENTHFVVERAIVQMLQGKTVRLGDPKPIRDFLYVDDHVNAYLTCLGNDNAVGETFNFCTGVGTSIRELVNIIGTLLDYEGEVIWKTVPTRPLDIKILVGDNSKAKNKLSWDFKIDLEDGLRKVIDYWKERVRNE